MRQHRLLATAAGVALVFLAGLFFIEAGWRHDAGLPVLNGNVLGGLMVSLAGLFSARYLPRLEAPGDWRPAFHLGALGLLAWGIAWWLGSGAFEIVDRVPTAAHVPVLVLFAAASAAASRWRAPRPADLSGPGDSLGPRSRGLSWLELASEESQARLAAVAMGSGGAPGVARFPHIG